MSDMDFSREQSSIKKRNVPIKEEGLRDLTFSNQT